MATHSSVLAWSIPGTQEPGGLPSMGSTESDTTERLTHMDFVNIGFGEILDFSLGVIALEIFENG